MSRKIRRLLFSCAIVAMIAILPCAPVDAGEPYLVADLTDSSNGDGSSSISGLEVVEDQVIVDFLVDRDPVVPGRSWIWSTDGTAGGTQPIAEPAGFDLSGADRLTPTGEALYFTGYEPTLGRLLLRWDNSGPPKVLDLDSGDFGVGPRNLTPAGERLYFTRLLDRDMELWRLNEGDASATFLAVLRPGKTDTAPIDNDKLTDAGPGEKGPYGPPYEDLYAVGNRVFAFVVTEINGNFQVDAEDEEWLWSSDGTPGGTARLRRVSFITAVGTIRKFAAELDGKLLFFSPGEGDHLELWRTDGTTAGTVSVHRFDEGDLLRPSFLVSHRGHAYFGLNRGYGCSDLWRTDGRRVEKLDTGCVRHAFSAGGQLYYTPSDVHHGTGELWRLVGEPPRAERVNILEGHSGFRFLAASPGLVYFGGDDGMTGEELWRSDGTADGTRPVGDIAAGPDDAEIHEVVFAKRQLLFGANDGVHGRELWAAPLSCVPTTETLCLGGGRFQVRARWSDPQGSFGAGIARTRPLIEESGAFWFFDEANIELAVKVLDGRELTGTFWVFYASLSNVEFELEVLDTETGELAVYQNPAGTLASVGDTQALPADGTSTIPKYLAPLASPATAPSTKSLCQPSPEALCLGGGRFRVTAAWQDFEGGTGTGVAATLSDETGTFWFFDAQNVELLVKILDGTDFNGHHWVFYASLSNVEFSLTVEDLETGQSQTYQNPAGTFASRSDTGTF